MKWLIGGAATALVCLGFMLFASGSSSNAYVQLAVNVALPVGLAALPAAIGVASCATACTRST